MEKELKELTPYQDPKTGLWGLKDEAGKILAEPLAYEIYPGNAFRREEDRLMGILNMKTGNEILKPSYHLIYSSGRFER